MMRYWVTWCVNHNLKFIVYAVWVLVLPFYFLNYVEEMAADALRDLKDIQKLTKKD